LGYGDDDNGTAQFINDLLESGIYQAHIDQDNPNEAGPVIVTLFNSSSPTGGITGELVGSITSANLEGQLQGKQLSDLIALINNGQTYVNVHSQENPNGEIRGTIEIDND
jgi:hypothetical protein